VLYLFGVPVTEIHASGVRARNALFGVFLIMGMASMAWVARIPEIKNSLGLSDGQFGLVLMSSSIGSVLGAQYSGRLVHSFGSRIVSRYAALLMPSGVIIMGLADSTAFLVLGLFVMGLGYAAIDVSANSQAVVIESLIGRSWMTFFHGMWSVGALSVTVLGGVLAAFVAPGANLIAVGLFCFLAYIPLTAALLSPDLDEHQGTQEEQTQSSIPWLSRSVFPLWAFGIGSLGSFVAEGAASDWGGILLNEHVGIGPGLSASAFASFALAMVVSRLTGDRVLARFGLARVVQLAGYVGAVAWMGSITLGVLLAESAQTLALVVICLGFAIAGLCIGPMFPAFIQAAARIDGIAAYVAIARIGVIGIAGYFIGPTIVGFIAELTSLPIALMYPGLLLAVTGLAARAMR
jgi:hypothetical protein